MVKDKVNFIDFPNVKIIELTDTEISLEYKIIYFNSKERILNYEDKKVLIKYPLEEMENGLTVLFMAYPLLEKKRRKNKGLTCHAAAVNLNGKGILILGKEGAGKTTLALTLCKKYNAKLIGNDLCVIDYNNLEKICLLGGTKYIFFRYESIKRNMPELLKEFNYIGNDCEVDTWTLKKKILPDKIDVKVEGNIIEIDKIFIVHIDQEKNLHVKKSDSLADRLYVNENFSRYIRNTCTTMINGKNLIDYIPSLDNKEFYLHRQELINYMFNNKNIEYLSGNIEDVSNYIIKKES